MAIGARSRSKKGCNHPVSCTLRREGKDVWRHSGKVTLRRECNDKVSFALFAGRGKRKKGRRTTLLMKILAEGVLGKRKISPKCYLQRKEGREEKIPPLYHYRD